MPVPAAVAGIRYRLRWRASPCPIGGWQQAFAVIGAIVAAITAFSRLALSVPPPDAQGS